VKDNTKTAFSTSRAIQLKDKAMSTEQPIENKNNLYVKQLMRTLAAVKKVTFPNACRSNIVAWLGK